MPPRRPLIGITTYHRDRSQRERFHVPAAYVDAVRLAGGLSVLLPPGDAHPDEILDAIDGLLLCGGGDIDPAQFEGHSGHEAQYATCRERDGFELALVRGSLERRMPLLAICRGLQVLNVLQGGDLHVHLPDVVGERVVHRLSQDRHTLHPVRLEPASRLAAVLGAADVEVASWHHQAVARLGDGLRAVAWAEDGTIEAVELLGHPEVLSVQWHPELQVADADSPHRRLFRELTARAGDRSAGLRRRGSEPPAIPPRKA
ncbi:gamma-glutamyl-gamma-aminobutyrate hydrolase family protein [Myxococcota bacterium]|nr:gamma-glutamyl-gamma-aminobutyrate hydrolase family protein [Myxococcota bacterium]MCZ7618669.1 gamma-glutamyl-gamma-aminobutyrate hydrolase family protein [Myxococcota bacterium]